MIGYKDGEYPQLMMSTNVVGLQLKEKTQKLTSKIQFKFFVKSQITKSALNFLNSKKDKLSKIKNIQYKKLEPQKYLKSNLFYNNEVEILGRLRSRNLDVKYKTKKYTFNNIEKIEFSIIGCSEIEDQQHLMKCKFILEGLRQKL